MLSTGGDPHSAPKFLSPAAEGRSGCVVGVVRRTQIPRIFPLIYPRRVLYATEISFHALFPFFSVVPQTVKQHLGTIIPICLLSLRLFRAFAILRDHPSGNDILREGAQLYRRYTSLFQEEITLVRIVCTESHGELFSFFCWKIYFHSTLMVDFSLLFSIHLHNISIDLYRRFHRVSSLDFFDVIV